MSAGSIDKSTKLLWAAEWSAGPSGSGKCPSMLCFLPSPKTYFRKPKSGRVLISKRGGRREICLCSRNRSTSSAPGWLKRQCPGTCGDSISSSLPATVWCTTASTPRPTGMVGTHLLLADTKPFFFGPGCLRRCHCHRGRGDGISISVLRPSE